MGGTRRQKVKEENDAIKISKKKRRNVICVIASFLHFTRHGTVFILSKL